MSDIEYVKVTPDIAMDWLTANTHNRPPKTRAISMYARDMKDGKWQRNGEAIKFSRDGKLLDGQNRLYAVIEADQTVEMLVVRNLEPEAQDTMDSGVKRRFADVLKLRGEENWTDLAAIVRRVHNWNHGTRYSSGAPPRSNTELTRTLEEHPELRDLARPAHYVSTKCAVPASVIGMCWWLFRQIDAEDADYFFERLASDEHHRAGDPIYELRKTAERQHTSRRSSFTQTILTACVVKAWNAYREGREVRSLRFSPGGAKPERFPEPM